MSTIRKGSQETVFDAATVATDLTSAVYDVSDSVGSLTLYATVPGDGSGVTVVLETAATVDFVGRWAQLASVSASGSGAAETKVAFAAGQVLFVRARLTGGIGTVTAILIGR